jgi:CubicO group peptidase (beta-lactamase class C family)
MTNIDGTCDDRFAKVRAAFADNFTERNDVGAAVAVTHNGRSVVDLWGGAADASGRPWHHDTLVNVWSTTKGMTSLCAHLLVDRGELDLDAPVARYWPEFAAAGKEGVLVRWVLSHRTGLSGLTTPTVATDYEDWDKIFKLMGRMGGIISTDLRKELPHAFNAAYAEHNYLTHLTEPHFIARQLAKRVARQSGNQADRPRQKRGPFSLMPGMIPNG